MFRYFLILISRKTDNYVTLIGDILIENYRREAIRIFLKIISY